VREWCKTYIASALSPSPAHPFFAPLPKLRNITTTVLVNANHRKEGQAPTISKLKKVILEQESHGWYLSPCPPISASVSGQSVNQTSLLCRPPFILKSQIRGSSPWRTEPKVAFAQTSFRTPVPPFFNDNFILLLFLRHRCRQR